MRAAPSVRGERLNSRPVSPKPSTDGGMTLELVLGSLLLTMVWGMAQPVIKGAYAGVTPYAMIWMRCCTGVLTLTLYRLLMRIPDSVTHHDPWKEKGHRILNALMHNVYVWFLYQGNVRNRRRARLGAALLATRLGDAAERRLSHR